MTTLSSTLSNMTLSHFRSRLLLASALIAAAAAASAGASGDFNGDGFDDLVVGIPDETIDDATHCGAVQVFYGSRDGLDTIDDQVWHKNKPDIEGDCRAFDGFGDALSWGDFDGDGFDDLAIGVPGQEVDSQGGAGGVAVLYGSRSGLRSRGNQVWTQASTGIDDDPEIVDLFGAALAAGDFNGDGFDDLAIAVPRESINGVDKAGALHIIFGSGNGLDGSGSQFLHQDTSGVADVVEMGDEFASSLTAGDFNGDGRDDLAVGMPDEDINAIGDAGAVQVFYGSANGLKVSNDQFWHQDSQGVPDRAEESDYFGTTCAAGDFNHDGFDDLAIGIEEEDLGLLGEVGAVQVLYGSAAGLTAAGDLYLHQDTPGVAGHAEDSDYFGTAVITGDFNNDGFGDLAVGIPFETLGGVALAGAVSILYGGQAGLRTDNDVLLHQNTRGVPDTNQTSDNWGAALAAGDFNGDGRDDLAVGAPDEGIAPTNAQTITDVSIRIFGLSHTFPDDLDIMLVGPEGQNLIVMSDAGGATDVVNISLSFSDAPGQEPLPDDGPLVPRLYNPANYDGGDADAFPPPAPAPTGSTFSVFDDTDPVGVWKLFVMDDFPSDSGAISQEWTLTLEGFGIFSSTDHPISIPGNGPASPYPSRVMVPKDAIQRAGAVTILFGSPAGIEPRDDSQFIHQNTPEVENKSESGERFGSTM